MGTTTYRVEFERIGRKRDVEPLIVPDVNADQLAERIYRYARPHLASRDVEVVVDMDEMAGHIFCGFQVGGRFKISEPSAAKATTSSGSGQ